MRVNWHSQRTRKTVLSIGLGLAWLDTLAGGIEASDSVGTDYLIGVGSFVLYAVCASMVWLWPVVGRFLTSWAFLFNVLLGVPLFVDFVWNIGGGAQAIQIVRSMLMAGLFFVYAWTWRPDAE